MKVMNFFSKFVSGLFIIAFGLLCIVATVFLLVKDMTSQKSITNYIKNANIFDYSANEVLSNDESNTLRKTIKNDLLALEIPPLVVDEVIGSEELDILISNYMYNYMQYIIYSTNKPVFPSQSILNILTEKYSLQEGKSLSIKQKEKVLDYIKLQGNKIDQGLLDQSEVDEMLSINIIKIIAKVFTSQYTLIVIAIILIILIAIIAICLSSIKLAIKWCSKIIILDGIILIVASFVEVRLLIMYFNNRGLIDSLAISIIEDGFKNMLVYGIVLIIIGIVFLTLCAISLKKEKKASKTLSDNLINSKETIIKEDEESKVVEKEKQEEISKSEQKVEETQQDESQESKVENNNEKNKPEEKKKEVTPEQNTNNQDNKNNNSNNNNNNQKNNEQPKQEEKKEDAKPEQNNINNQDNKNNNSKNNNNNQKNNEQPKQEEKKEDVKPEQNNNQNNKNNNSNNSNNNQKNNEQPKQEEKKEDVKPEQNNINNQDNKNNNSKNNNNNQKNNEQPKQEQQKTQESNIKIKDETKIIPVSEKENKTKKQEEKTKFIELEKVAEEETKQEFEPDGTKYYELTDDKNIEPVKDHKIQAKPLKEAQINVTFPKVGKPIEPVSNKNQDDEDIEIL